MFFWGEGTWEQSVMTSQSTELVNSTVAEVGGRNLPAMTFAQWDCSAAPTMSRHIPDAWSNSENAFIPTVISRQVSPTHSATVELTNSVDCKVITDFSHVLLIPNHRSAFPESHSVIRTTVLPTLTGARRCIPTSKTCLGFL
jgi:hypothetical protein